MPTRKKQQEGKQLQIDFGTLNPKQREFMYSKTFYTCYGGARGGGKSHVVRLKAVGMALRYPGIRILMVRCHYNELKENLIDPILSWVPSELYSYNGADHQMVFNNGKDGKPGSTIKFGHWDNEASALAEYQGLQYDVVFLEEATQVSERAFQILSSDIRGVNDFPKRMYLTCNPGGVGHRWVKRLFIDRKYRNDPNDPEANEDPNDYKFIFATVDDNTYLLESSPKYLQQLAALPEDLKRAWRYGDWSALSGSFFGKSFSEKTHCCTPFKIPKTWTLYRSIDYGLDMFVCIWWAVDTDGRAWAFREYEKPGLVMQDAVERLLENTLPDESITMTFAPPDMWNRQKETGKTMAEVFLNNGVPINKADNNRVQGHMIMKSMMMPIPLTDPDVIAKYPKGKAPKNLPGLIFFKDMQSVISDIADIQADPENPNDCCKEPHDVTHTVDACRYFCISRIIFGKEEEEKKKRRWEASLEDENDESYADFMCGGQPTAEYMGA